MSNKITILKDKTDGTYQIQFAKNAKIFIQSLFHAKLFQSHTSTITDNYQTLIIKAKSITKFDDFLNFSRETNTQEQFENKKYDIALQIIQDLIKQMKSLFDYKHTFYAFSLEHLLVIDNQTFIYLNLEHLLPLDIESKIKKQNPTLTLKIPFQREIDGLFLSPEIQKMNELPFSLDYKTIYYSLGALIIYFLFDKQIQENNIKINELLKPIKETKLYWFLLRIMKTNPEERWLYF